MRKRLAMMVVAGAVLCSGSVAALEVMTQRAEATMSDMVTVVVPAPKVQVQPAVDSSMERFVADRARFAR